jgi:hypothetical protein
MSKSVGKVNLRKSLDKSGEFDYNNTTLTERETKMDRVTERNFHEIKGAYMRAIVANDKADAKRFLAQMASLLPR